MNELEIRLLYAELQLENRVEVIHHIKIGFREHDTRTVGTVVKKERRQRGIDSKFARIWDDAYWFYRLVLRRDEASQEKHDRPLDIVTGA